MGERERNVIFVRERQCIRVRVAQKEREREEERVTYVSYERLREEWLRKRVDSFSCMNVSEMEKEGYWLCLCIHMFIRVCAN